MRVGILDGRPSRCKKALPYGRGFIQCFINNGGWLVTDAKRPYVQIGVCGLSVNNNTHWDVKW